MTDNLSREQRSAQMSRISGKNTAPEVFVRSLLHRMGYRFRVHVKSLPGTPDIVLPKYRTILFVHGCFWHRHSGCPLTYQVKSNKGFWREKFRKNLDRDRRTAASLVEMGWTVAVIWQCEVKEPVRLKQRLLRILK